MISDLCLFSLIADLLVWFEVNWKRGEKNHFWGLVFCVRLLLQRRHIKHGRGTRGVLGSRTASRAALSTGGGLSSLLSLVPVSCEPYLLLRTVFCFPLLETRISASSSLCSLRSGSPNASACPCRVTWLSQILLLLGKFVLRFRSWQ